MVASTSALLALVAGISPMMMVHAMYPVNNVTVTLLEKSSNATGGLGNMAASGTLSPFGSIGIGCGLNWKNGVSYGGGLTAGSKDFGLGGGYTITPTTMEVDAGIGIATTNSSANVMFKGNTNGTLELNFSSASAFTCTETYASGTYSLVCKTV